MKQSNNKIHFLISVFILIFCILILFIIYPIFRSVKVNADTLSSLKEKIFLIGKQNKEIHDFKKKYDQYKENLDNLKGMFVDIQDPVNFIEFIEKLGKEENANDLNISIANNAIKDSKGRTSILFKVSFSSGFSNIVRFSEKLEHGNYLAKVNQLDIKQENGKLLANFLIQVQ